MVEFFEEQSLAVTTEADSRSESGAIHVVSIYVTLSNSPIITDDPGVHTR